MKQKFKTTVILMSLLLIISLVAAQCGGAAPTEQTAKEPAPTEAVEAAPTEAAAEPTEAPAEATEEAMAEATEEAMAEATEEAMAEGSGMALPEINPLDVTGDIISAGSSTVFPLSERMAERFQDEGYAGNITIDSIGSGAGFERFCVAGETDISNASRAINEEEIASCESIGRTPIEFRVGTDALAVVVSAENDFLTDVTLEELALLFSTAQKWSDVRPDWPAEDILRFSPGTDSGTFDYFVEAVMDEYYVKEEADEGKGEEAILKAASLQLSEDDNVLAQGVEGSPYAIGYFGYAYYQNEADALKAVSINGIEPTAETAENGDYPLARPLFIYSDAKIMAEKPQVAAFINFYLTYVNEEIEDIGYFPASPAALDTAKNNWMSAAGGEMSAAEPAEAAAEATEEAMAEGSGMALPEINPLDVTGDIISAGSSTVFPLSE
ncbi:MAG: PstS family phosphate ABC transporter substrate-binding protein, partial [Anaerolineales bacterium]|nr:PstS family phosphate ABC transporter substrate-binding protein [Anaerolineales bacterium]